VRVQVPPGVQKTCEARLFCLGLFTQLLVDTSRLRSGWPVMAVRVQANTGLSHLFRSESLMVPYGLPFRRTIPYLVSMKMFFVALLSTLAACTEAPKKENSQNANDSVTQMIQEYALVNGIRMYYEIHGKGEPLVLIHGGGSTIESNWSVMLPLLSRHFKVIAVEMQAHGHTSDRDAPETFQQDADDVVALLKAINIPKASIMGFSNGGSTAMQVGIRHPEVVNKLVVASAVYKREGLMPGFFDFMETASLDNMPKPLQEAFLKINPDTARLQNMHDKDRDRMRAFKDWPDDDLRSIKAPTLLINADRDVVLNSHALKMRELIPKAELLIVPGTHGSFLGEVCAAEKGSKMPEQVASIVIEFLSKEDR
jgi:pimeloyl-ACP methyl ester carboxylesterase